MYLIYFIIIKLLCKDFREQKNIELFYKKIFTIRKNYGTTKIYFLKNGVVQMKKLKVILLGTGNRGRSYLSQMSKEKYQVVAVAEPKESLRNYIKETFNVPKENCCDT